MAKVNQINISIPENAESKIRESILNYVREVVEEHPEVIVTSRLDTDESTGVQEREIYIATGASA